MSWDILDLDENNGWAHLQILERLHEYDIDCYFADMWTDGNIAWLVGCKANASEVAKVLGLSRKSVYADYEHCFIFLNLFQEKYLRGLL